MTFLYLNSDTMGNGPDQTLGKKLLLLFLEKLALSNIQIDVVGCANGAVNFTTQDGPALGHLKKLQSRGAKIASCGTCLDHLGLRPHLKIGEVGNMDMTVQMMASADRIIRP